MKHKLLTFALMGAFASTMLFSCKNVEEPIMLSDNVAMDNKTIECKFSINVSDEVRTRGYSEATIGENGLLEFPCREINRLWYAFYVGDKLLFHSEMEEAPKPVYKANGSFELSITYLQNQSSAAKIFFWAGNTEDNVTIGKEDITEHINFDFENKKVNINPTYMNGDGDYKIIDSFASYMYIDKLTNTQDDSFHKTIILKRPFALFHILTDEFIDGSLGYVFPDGISTNIRFVEDYSRYALPTTWNYEYSLGNYTNNDDLVNQQFNFSSSDYTFKNNLSGSNPERTTYKGKQMDYLGYLYSFAPSVGKFCYLSKGLNTSYWTEVGRVSLVFYNGTNSVASTTVDLKGGDFIKANNIYVIYNSHKEDDDTGYGFLSNSYNIDVITDPEWGEMSENVF